MFFRFKRLLFLALTGLILNSAALAEGDAAGRLREIAATSYGGDRPGASVMVYRDGKILLHEAFGLASLELDVPMSTDNRFRIASVTKQFTGAVVASLVGDGVLDLDADIRTYLPDFADKGGVITLRHLLHHISGLYNYTNNDDYERIAHTDISLEETRSFYENMPLDFPVGSDWSYSNSGYALASLIIEKATGRKFADVVAERLFKPAGMANTQFQLHAAVMKKSPSQYWRAETRFYPAERAGQSGRGDGEIYSTTGDLLNWYKVLQGDQLLSADERQMLFASAVLPDGRDIRYGMGLFHGHVGGYATYEHGGNVGGWRAYVIMAPEADLFVAVLANASDQNEELVASSLAKAALGLDHEKPAALVLAAKSLTPLAGVYRHAPNDQRVIRVKDGRLQSRRGEGAWYNLVPIAKDRFIFEDDPDTQILFDGRGLRVSYRYGMDNVAVRVAQSPN